MNALDQAFIKAFTQDRPVTADERASAATCMKAQPPVSGVDSTALVLHDLNPQGLRFRVDRPTESAPVRLATHMHLPIAEPMELLVCPSIPLSGVAAPEFDSLAGQGDACVQRSTTDVEIGWHDLDPELLTAAVPAEEIADAVGAVPVAADAYGEEAVSGDCRLSEAEEAALLQGLEQLASKPFTPAWEVDAFHWPDLCSQLDAASGAKLTQSGEELNVAMQDGLKVIAIVSTSREEGRSTLALSLARSAAIAGSRVALLDADGKNPELARRLGLEAPCDWQEAIRQRQSLAEAAVASLEDGVTLFPLTVPCDTLSGRLDDSLLGEVLQELKQHFDLVVIDTQPLPAEAVAVVAVPLPRVTRPCAVDMAVLVRNVQTTPQDECLAAVAGLRAMGVRTVGIVENFSPAVEACEVSHV
ncbi:MAG: tyrosine-protein kinase family protein [Pirellulaceae bacterium]